MVLNSRGHIGILALFLILVEMPVVFLHLVGADFTAQNFSLEENRKTHLFSSSLARWGDRYYWNPHLCFQSVVKTPALPIHSAIINSVTLTCHRIASNTLQSSKETGGMSAKK